MMKTALAVGCSLLILLSGCAPARTPVSPEQQMVAQLSKSLTSAGYIDEALKTTSEKTENSAVWGDYTYRGYTVQTGLYYYTCSDAEGDVLEACAYCDSTLFPADDYTPYNIYGYMSGILLTYLDPNQVETIVDEMNLDDPDLFLESQYALYSTDRADYALIYDINDGKMFLRATMQEG